MVEAQSIHMVKSKETLGIIVWHDWCVHICRAGVSNKALVKNKSN